MFSTRSSFRFSSCCVLLQKTWSDMRCQMPWSVILQYNFTAHCHTGKALCSSARIFYVTIWGNTSSEPSIELHSSSSKRWEITIHWKLHYSRWYPIIHLCWISATVAFTAQTDADVGHGFRMAPHCVSLPLPHFPDFHLVDGFVLSPHLQGGEEKNYKYQGEVVR